MSTAEFLPDKINMMNEDGDVVAIDQEPDATEFLSDLDELSDPGEGDWSPNYFVVEDIIRSGIEKSREDGYAAPKVKVGERSKPLGQFLAVDAYKYGLSMEEIRDLLEKYTPYAGVPRSMGRAAVSESLRPEPSPDVRMLAANDDTYRA